MNTYRCIVLNRSWLANNPLDAFIKRTGCLDVVWTGAFSEEAIQRLQTEQFDLVIASLPLEETLSDSMIRALRQLPWLILTSSYPKRRQTQLGLQPLAYLHEPFSADQFQQSVQTFITLHQDSSLQ